jgi:hypothetical protein
MASKKLLHATKRVFTAWPPAPAPPIWISSSGLASASTHLWSRRETATLQDSAARLCRASRTRCAVEGNVAWTINNHRAASPSISGTNHNDRRVARSGGDVPNDQDKGSRGLSRKGGPTRPRTIGPTRVPHRNADTRATKVVVAQQQLSSSATTVS